MVKKCWVGGMQQMNNNRMTGIERKIHTILKYSPLNGSNENCGLPLLCPNISVEHGIISCQICVAKYIAQEVSLTLQ